MMVNLVCEIDRELDYAREALGSLSKKAPMAVRTALNKTAKEVKTLDEKEAKATYTAKRSYINKLSLKKASVSNLDAILADSGGKVSMTHFKYYAGKKGLTTLINTKKGVKQVAPNGIKAFYIPENARAFKNSIAVRLGRPRLPIQKLYSISSPGMHGSQKYVWGEIEPDVRTMLHENVKKEVERMIKAI